VPAKISTKQGEQKPPDSPQVFDAIDGPVPLSSAGVQFRNLHKPKDGFTLTCSQILLAAPAAELPVRAILMMQRFAR
jgi:hypothetical protein